MIALGEPLRVQPATPAALAMLLEVYLRGRTGPIECAVTRSAYRYLVGAGLVVTRRDDGWVTAATHELTPRGHDTVAGLLGLMPVLV